MYQIEVNIILKRRIEWKLNWVILNKMDEPNSKEIELKQCTNWGQRIRWNNKGTLDRQESRLPTLIIIRKISTETRKVRFIVPVEKGCCSFND